MLLLIPASITTPIMVEVTMVITITTVIMVTIAKTITVARVTVAVEEVFSLWEWIFTSITLQTREIGTDHAMP